MLEAACPRDLVLSRSVAIDGTDIPTWGRIFGDEETMELDAAPSPYLGSDAEVRVTYHPSALTRNPDWPGRFDDDVGWLDEP